MKIDNLLLTFENTLTNKLILCRTSFSLLCTYKEPSSNNSTFFIKLNYIINSDNLFNDYTLLVGDMNINIGNDNIDNEYLYMLATNGFHSLINVYTRFPINKAHTCIDHIVFLKCKI